VEKCESSFVVGSLGRVVSPRPPSWAVDPAVVAPTLIGVEPLTLPRPADARLRRAIAAR